MFHDTKTVKTRKGTVFCMKMLSSTIFGNKIHHDQNMYIKWVLGKYFTVLKVQNTEQQHTHTHTHTHPHTQTQRRKKKKKKSRV